MKWGWYNRYRAFIKNLEIKNGKPNDVNERRKNYFIHHIKMKSLGGSDEKENLVWVNFKEHVKAHWLLNMALNRETSSMLKYSIYRANKSNKNKPN